MKVRYSWHRTGDEVTITRAEVSEVGKFAQHETTDVLTLPDDLLSAIVKMPEGSYEREEVRIYRIEEE